MTAEVEKGGVYQDIRLPPQFDIKAAVPLLPSTLDTPPGYKQWDTIYIYVDIFSPLYGPFKDC